MSKLRAKSVEAATPIPRKTKDLTSLRLRNAYRLKLVNPEYNVGTSARHPTSQERVKIYAELTRTTPHKRKKPRIKSHGDNILEYSWKQLYVNISISRDEELKNMGDAQVIDLVKSKTKIAEDTMTDLLGDGLYSAGTNTKSILGTRTFIVGTGSTVGGISTTDNSWWRAQTDASTTTLSLAAMQTVFNNCSINNKTPTLLLATRANYNRYYALLQPQQRFVDGDSAKGGFQNLMFNGVPLIVGSKVPSGHIVMINEDNVYLKVHKDEDMRFEPFQKPINQNVRTAKIYWFGAFCADNLRMNGVLSAITA